MDWVFGTTWAPRSRGLKLKTWTNWNKHVWNGFSFLFFSFPLRSFSNKPCGLNAFSTKTKHTRSTSLFAITLDIVGLLSNLSTKQGFSWVCQKRHAQTHSVQIQVSYGNRSVQQKAGGQEKTNRRHWGPSRLLLFTKGLTEHKCAEGEGKADKSFRKAQSFRKRIHLEMTTKEVPPPTHTHSRNMKTSAFCYWQECLKSWLNKSKYDKYMHRTASWSSRKKPRPQQNSINDLQRQWPWLLQQISALYSKRKGLGESFNGTESHIWCRRRSLSVLHSHLVSVNPKMDKKKKRRWDKDWQEQKLRGGSCCRRCY